MHVFRTQKSSNTHLQTLKSAAKSSATATWAGPWPRATWTWTEQRIWSLARHSRPHVATSVASWPFCWRPSGSWRTRWWTRLIWTWFCLGEWPMSGSATRLCFARGFWLWGRPSRDCVPTRVVRFQRAIGKLKF